MNKIYHSNNSGDFEILENNGSNNVKIRFIKTGTTKIVSMHSIIQGCIKDPVNYKSKVSDKIYTSMYYGDFKIINDLGNNLNKHGDRFVQIQFLYTGSIITERYDHVRERCVKDPAFNNPFKAREVLGPIPMSNPRQMMRQTWNQLIRRCTQENGRGYYKYGARGVSICDRWLDFNNFYYDAILLPGWILKFNDPIMHQLDKDLLQYNLPHNKRIYSPNTCIWVPLKINQIIANGLSSSIGIINGIYTVDGLYYVTTIDRNYGPFDDYDAAVNMIRYHSYGQFISNAPYMPPDKIIQHNLDAREMCKIV